MANESTSNSDSPPQLYNQPAVLTVFEISSDPRMYDDLTPRREACYCLGIILALAILIVIIFLYYQYAVPYGFIRQL